MAEIPNDILLAAQAAQARYHVPASVTIAQWALESAYGRHVPPGSSNPFGIKAKAGQAYVAASTWEVDHGANVRVVQKFAKYASLAEAFEAHAHLLATVAVYKPAMDAWYKAHDLATGVALMAQHYATDPSYATKVMAIIRAHGLAAHDSLPQAATQSIAPPPVASPKTAALVPSDPFPALADSLDDLIDEAVHSLAPVASSAPARDPSPSTTGSTDMNPLLAISILEQVMTYAPMIENVISKIPDIVAKAKDAVAKFSKMDFNDGVTDIEEIVADLGITQATLSTIIGHATNSAPPATATAHA